MVINVYMLYVGTSMYRNMVLLHSQMLLAQLLQGFKFFGLNLISVTRYHSSYHRQHPIDTMLLELTIFCEGCIFETLCRVMNKMCIFSKCLKPWPLFLRGYGATISQQIEGTNWSLCHE